MAITEGADYSSLPAFNAMNWLDVEDLRKLANPDITPTQQRSLTKKATAAYLDANGLKSTKALVDALYQPANADPDIRNSLTTVEDLNPSRSFQDGDAAPVYVPSGGVAKTRDDVLGTTGSTQETINRRRSESSATTFTPDDYVSTAAQQVAFESYGFPGLGDLYALAYQDWGADFGLDPEAVQDNWIQNVQPTLADQLIPDKFTYAIDDGFVTIDFSAGDEFTRSQKQLLFDEGLDAFKAQLGATAADREASGMGLDVTVTAPKKKKKSLFDKVVGVAAVVTPGPTLTGLFAAELTNLPSTISTADAVALALNPALALPMITATSAVETQGEAIRNLGEGIITGGEVLAGATGSNTLRDVTADIGGEVAEVGGDIVTAAKVPETIIDENIIEPVEDLLTDDEPADTDPFEVPEPTEELADILSDIDNAELKAQKIAARKRQKRTLATTRPGNVSGVNFATRSGQRI